MDALQHLTVAAQLRDTIQLHSRQLMARLEASLAAVCTDFDPEAYTKVLEGYMCVDMVAQLSDDVKAAFASSAGLAATKVVRGVMLTRAGDDEALAGPLGGAESLQDLLKRLPKDLFRTALANVLMVTFDIMASHHRMATWHRDALERHAVELSRIQRYKHDVRVRMGEAPVSPRTPRGLVGPPVEPMLEAPLEAQLEVGSCVAWMRTVVLISVTSLFVVYVCLWSFCTVVTEVPQDLEGKERAELEWGQVLQTIASGLADARRLMWDEAARKISALLSSQAGYEGEHFLQVLDWSRRIVEVGEAFSGLESGALRTSLARQSGAFFRSFHRSNLEARGSCGDRPAAAL